MQFYVNCPNCKEELVFKARKSDVGNIINITCNECNTVFETKISDQTNETYKNKSIFHSPFSLVGLAFLGFIIAGFIFGPSICQDRYGFWKAFDSGCKIGASFTDLLSNTENSGDDVLEKIKKNVVWVKYEVSGKLSDGRYFADAGGSGSGIIYFQDDSILQIFTNRHVVDCDYSDIGCYQRITEKITVRTYDGKLHTVSRVLYAPHNLDIAVLEINTDVDYNPTYLKVEEVQIGEKVIAIGYPQFVNDFTQFTISEGSVTGKRDILTGGGFGFKAIYSDAYTSFGSSGGGLFNKDGNLVGINTWVAGQASVATSISIIDDIKSYITCESGGYLVGDVCYSYCAREEVLGSDGRCYNVCDDYYCESTIPQANNPGCEDPNFIVGRDQLCHEACTSTTYCFGNSICYRNSCVSCPFGKELFKDGTCRYYK